VITKLTAPAMPAWLAAQLPFERYAVEIDGHRVHVMEAGDPHGRPVLMLHGNPTWGFLWRRVASALRDTPLRLIMPDLVGLGLSDKPRNPHFHQLDAHGRIMAGLLERLALEDLIFIGQDWGGPVGLYALAEKPRLWGLVLLNTVVGPPRPGFRPTAFHRFARLPVVSDLAFRALKLPQRTMWSVQGDRRSIRGQVARAYRWPLRRVRDNVAPLALARMVPDSLEHPTIPALQRCQTVIEAFKGPAAIVWGDRDPVLGRVRTHVERLLPRARVTRTQAGHFLQEEVPGEIADAVKYVAGVR
jgi:cis-3-alkyl-4-acyloxetan-2-one decarboxylase